MNKDYVYKNRLLLLADFLDKLPEERFDYLQWVGDDWQGKTDLSCGTNACALGWATTIPSLRRAGLRLFRHNIVGPAYVRLNNDPSSDPAKAAENVFDLNYAEYCRLFVPFGSRMYITNNGRLPDDSTAKEVAEHIRNFVKKKYPDKNK